MKNFTFIDGVEISVIAIVIVILILFCLFLLIKLFNFLPKEKILQPLEKVTPNSLKVSDDEERIVTMIVASIHARKSSNKDVVIRNITKIN